MWNGGLQSHVEFVVVEGRVAQSKAGELPGSWILVRAANDALCDQTVFQDVLVEVVGVAAHVADEVVGLRSDIWVNSMYSDLSSVSISLAERRCQARGLPCSRTC